MPMPKATVATTTSNCSWAKALLRLAALGRLHARVIVRRAQAALLQEAGHGLGVLAAEAIDDGGLARVPPQHFQRLRVAVHLGQDPIHQVRAVEPSDQHRGLAEAEVACRMSSRTRAVAVAVKACRLARGKRSRSTASCRYSGRKSCPQWLMQWASSMTKRRMSSCASLLQEAGLEEPLRRDEEQPILAFGQPGLDAPPLLVGQVAVQCGGRITDAGQAIDLVLHQGDERGDDHVGPAGDQRRRLVAERLAAAGRQHDQRIASGQGHGDGFALQRPERVEAPAAADDVQYALFVGKGKRLRLSMGGVYSGSRGISIN